MHENAERIDMLIEEAITRVRMGEDPRAVQRSFNGEFTWDITAGMCIAMMRRIAECDRVMKEFNGV